MRNERLLLLLSILINTGVCLVAKTVFLLVPHVLIAILSLARLLELMLAIKAPTNSGKLVAWIIISVPATVLFFKLAGYFGSMGWVHVAAEVVIVLLGVLLLLFIRGEQRKNP